MRFAFPLPSFFSSHGRSKGKAEQRWQRKGPNGSMEGQSETPYPIPQNNNSLTQLPQAAQIGKEYEAQGGDYENEPGSKNKPEKGPPQKKSEATKSKETKAETNGDSKGTEKKTGNAKKESKPKKEPMKGVRSSSRQAAAGEKRKSSGGDGKESAKKARK